MTRAVPRVTVHCQQCGREFLVMPLRALDPTRGKFCGKACYWASKHKPQRPIEERFWEKVDKSSTVIRPGMTTPCWLWLGGHNGKGYGKFGMGGRAGVEVNAQRAAWLLTNGPIVGDLLVCHTCDNPPCVRLDHLFLGSAAENMLDKVTKDRQQRGGGVPNAKLTEAQAIEIRRRFAAGDVEQKALAIEYGVAGPTISNLIQRKTWKHLD